MIPKLNLQDTIEQDYALFLKALAQTAYSGEIRTDYGSRLIAATDNSIYQILPQAVVFPKSGEDIAAIFELSQRDQFQSITFSPRGGGTGTNGQSLASGIIIDCSKYMNQILEVNLKEKWVRVQPGVVLDQLNAHLSDTGFFFAPTLSTSNRATLGGMINTDACGKGSRIYGKTSNHVLELSYVFQDGTQWTSSEITPGALKKLKGREDIVGETHRQVDEIVTEKKDLIQDQFPKLSRFMTGYNLGKVYTDDRKHFNMNFILTGSEGTLAVISEAKLKLTALPKYKQLVVVKYRSFDDALKDAQNLLANNPGAIETIDEKILALAKEDEIYYYVKDFIADESHAATQAINLVEFTGNNIRQLNKDVNQLCRTVEKNKEKPHQAIGYYRTEVPGEIAQLWNLRKKGVGLLGNAKGPRKPIPFVEDTAVPPEHLADFIAEFKALFAKHNLEYGMFGHVDVGCLHVRPALDMKDENDEALVREISDRVADLVQKYGGVMWAEHGRGYRSEYAPRFFGRELYQDLRKIKGAFDPQNRLNPGKIVSPHSMEDKVVKVEAPLRGHFDKQIAPGIRDEYESTVNCNGNGLCFTYDPHHVMCPSSKVTRDRIHSPKGRAGMVREWLRQLELADGDAQSPLALQKTKANPLALVKKGKNWVQRIQNSWGKSKGDYDFSHEVYEAMRGCLACKACATQCPIHVDIPEVRAKFYDLYFTRYLRPVRDYLVGWIEYITPMQAKMAKISNYLVDVYASRMMLSKFIGMCDVPKLSLISVKEGLQARHALYADPAKMANLSEDERKRSVILLQDVFTTFYEAQLVLDVYDLLRMLGYVVYIAPFQANGKPLHIKGFMQAFKNLAQKNTQTLSKLGSHEVPIIGIEPSIVLTYRDEYLKVLETDDLGFKVHLLQEWLSANIDQFKERYTQKDNATPYRLFGHCMEITGAMDAQKQWKHIFQVFGMDLQPMSTGCCGMSGTYGHESEHYGDSKGIYSMGWRNYIVDKASQTQQVLVTGYSCRSQVKRFDGFTPFHPAQALLRELSVKS